MSKDDRSLESLSRADVEVDLTKSSHLLPPSTLLKLCQQLKGSSSHALGILLLKDIGQLFSVAKIPRG